MELIDNVYIMNLIGFILGIVSVVLAVVSIVFSAIFFWWGKKQNEVTSILTTKIEEKVICLEKLFDKMYDSTYQLVRENNQAMQRELFKNGSYGAQTIENRDMDVFLLIDSKKRITKSDICNELNITRPTVDEIVKRMIEKNTVKISPDGETVIKEVCTNETLGSSSDEMEKQSTSINMEC